MVNKEDFLTIYNKYKPNWFIKFMFERFSNKNFKFNFKKENIFITLLIIIFVIFNITAIVLKSNDYPKNVYLIFLFIAILTLALVVLSGFIAVLLNNLRIKKIRKKLNMSQDEYEAYVSIYIEGKYKSSYFL